MGPDALVVRDIAVVHVKLLQKVAEVGALCQRRSLAMVNPADRRDVVSRRRQSAVTIWLDGLEDGILSSQTQLAACLLAA